MSEEIKEILEQLKDSVDYPKIDMPTFDGTDSEFIDNDTLLEPDKCKLLLDYITNLQQENEKEKQFIKDCGFQNQQQLVLAYLNYKSRCEKAIEYINNLWSFPGGYFEVAINIEENKSIEIDGNDYIDNLLNILNKGSDKE